MSTNPLFAITSPTAKAAPPSAEGTPLVEGGL